MRQIMSTLRIALFEARGQFLQHTVAHLVAILVIHRLEVVDIEREQREALAAIDGMLDKRGGLVLHVAAVVEAGQGIGDGKLHRRLHVRAQLISIAAALDLGVGARQEFLLVDRADQVVVHAHVEGAQKTLVIVGVDDDQDWRLARALERFELRAQAQAVNIVHVEIDDDELVAGFGRVHDGGQRVIDDGHLMMRNERRFGALAGGGAIVDDEAFAGPRRVAIVETGHQPDSFAIGRTRTELVGEHFEPDQAFHPAEQSHVVDRLGQEVVGTRLEALDAILRLIEGGHHDHRDMMSLRVALDLAANLNAVDARHHHVEQHDVGLRPLDRTRERQHRSWP